jgi:hypothetical protein
MAFRTSSTLSARSWGWATATRVMLRAARVKRILFISVVLVYGLSDDTKIFLSMFNNLSLWPNYLSPSSILTIIPYLCKDCIGYNNLY